MPLALALFHESTISALRLYLPKEEVTAGFFNLIRIWWLSVNSKERFHPLRKGNALVSNDSKAELYISLSLSEHIQCPVCLSSLNNNLVSSEYVSNLNQGGLTLPCTSLQHYVLNAFCLLEVSEREIRSSSFPWKSLALALLSIATVEWDSTFACSCHSEKSKELVNKITSNIYFNNLRKQVSETRRKDQVTAFKSNKRQKF